MNNEILEQTRRIALENVLRTADAMRGRPPTTRQVDDLIREARSLRFWLEQHSDGD